MKLLFLIFTLIFFIGCSGAQENAPDPNREKIIAKNKQTAVTNEITLITQAAQKIEKEGRALDLYRNSREPKSQTECKIVMESSLKEIQTLADRIAKLPEEKAVVLAPITTELNECVACAKDAAKSCVKARASINEAIKKLF